MPINPLQQILYIIPSVTSHNLKSNCEAKRNKKNLLSLATVLPHQENTKLAELIKYTPSSKNIL